MATPTISGMTPARIEKGIVKLNDMRLNALSSGNNQLADEYARQIKVLGGELKMADPEKRTKMQLEQRQAQEALRTGMPIGMPSTELGEEFKSAFPNVPTMESAVEQIEQFETQLPNLIGKLFQAPPDKVDVKSGLPARDRFNMGYLPTPEDKLTYLKSKYGDNNVYSINIAGTQSNVVKRKDGSIVLADEVGIGVKDILDLSGEAAPTIASIGAAAMASPSGPGAIGAGGAAYLSVSSLQDAVMRDALGTNIKPGEILQRRGIETALGMAGDVAGLGFGKYAARRVGKNITSGIAQSLDEGASVLRKAGFDVETPKGALRGIKGLEKQQELAARFPSSQQRMAKNLSQLGLYQETLSTGRPVTDRAFQSTLSGLRAQYDDLLSEIGKKDKQARDIIASNIDRKLGELQNPTFKAEPIGNELLKYLETGKNAVAKLEKESYRGIYDKADEYGVSVKPEELINAIKKETSKFKDILDDSEVNIVLSELSQKASAKGNAKILRERIAENYKLNSPSDVDEFVKSGPGSNFLNQLNKLSLDSAPMGLEDINLYIQRLQEKVPSGGMVGTGKTSPRVASAAGDALRKIRDTKLKEAGLFEEFDQIRNRHINDKLLFERNSPGSILKEVLGDTVLTPTQAVERSISDPKNIRDVLRAVELGSPERAPYMRGQLQKAYLNKIGLTADRGTPSAKIDFDPEIVTELYGVSPAGKVNENYGKMMVDKLNELNAALADKKLNISNVNPRDISDLYSALSEDSRRSVIKKITESAQLQSQADKMLDNALISAAKKGDWNKVDVAEFSKTMFRAPVSDINSFITRMPKAERKALQADFVAELLARYGSSGNYTPNGIELFDGTKFLKDFSKDRTLGTRIRNIMGEEFLTKFKAAAAHIDANKVTDKQIAEVSAKATLSRGGPGIWLITRPGWVANRFYAAMHDNKMLIPLLELQARNVGPEQMEKNMKKAIIGVMGTRRGLESLGAQGRNDPEFSAESQKILDEAINSGMIQK